MKKTLIIFLRVTYWLSFTWCFAAGFACGGTFTGAALSILSALHCAIAFAYHVLDEKINASIRTLREENDSLRRDVGIIQNFLGKSLW